VRTFQLAHSHIIIPSIVTLVYYSNYSNYSNLYEAIQQNGFVVIYHKLK